MYTGRELQRQPRLRPRKTALCIIPMSSCLLQCMHALKHPALAAVRRTLCTVQPVTVQLYTALLPCCRRGIACLALQQAASAHVLCLSPALLGAEPKEFWL